MDKLWDFALIRLAEAVGLDRGHAICNPLVSVPRPGGTVYVFQHPDRAPQKVDAHAVHPPPDGTRTFLPRLRFLHTANTSPGSSGGPCFDRDFMLCGLHQGVWTRDDARQQVVNRGIPLARIADFLTTQQGGLPSLDPQEYRIASLDPGSTAPAGDTPVIGCDGFLAQLWETALTGRTSILVISGTEKSGKSFRLDVARAVLPEPNHLKVTINTPQVATLGAEEFATQLCMMAGAALPSLQPRTEADTTPAAWLKVELVPKVIAALNEARRGRYVWLMMADLNRCDAYGLLTSDFLYLLYEQVLTNDWLRLILDGMKGDVPASLRPVIIPHEVPQQIGHAEIRTYMARRLTERGVGGVDPNFFNMAVPLLQQIYTLNTRDVAIKALANAARDVVSQYPV